MVSLESVNLQGMGVEAKILIFFTPQIIHLFIGVSIIFTIQFGGKIPLFLETPTSKPMENRSVFTIGGSGLPSSFQPGTSFPWPFAVPGCNMNSYAMKEFAKRKPKVVQVFPATVLKKK